MIKREAKREAYLIAAQVLRDFLGCGGADFDESLEDAIEELAHQLETRCTGGVVDRRRPD